ncbi:MAG: tRNA pseudouridine synthase A [Thermoproteota archaeon]|nr:tRNA pseudouridine synthase A [Candidatus Brockarchaeota archaeon]
MRNLVDVLKFRTIVKEEYETDPNYGEYPEKRSVERLLKLGIINLDKPPGPSSHDVSSTVKKILGVEKAGHAGTLEEMGRSRRFRCVTYLP